MATAFQINVASQNAAAKAICDLIDAGAAAGKLNVRTGLPPASCAAGETGGSILLASLSFFDPAFSAPVNGVASANSISSAVAGNSGDAGYFRATDSNNVVVFQGSAGNAGDSPDMVFNNKAIVAGGNVSCTAMSLIMPVS